MAEAMTDENAKMYELTERYTGERQIYVYATSKSAALEAARNGDSVQEDDPTHFAYRYVGPVSEVEEFGS
jgi:hypothetical protein